MQLTTTQKMGLARGIQRPVLLARRAFRRGPLTRVRRRGLAWELDLHEGIDFAIWLQGAFERSVVTAYHRLPLLGTTVLDIGANIGAHTLHLARAVGANGAVIAFEPTKTAFDRLTRNVALNSALCDRIRLEQVMLLGSDDAQLPDEVISSWPLLPRRELHPTIPGRHQATTGAQACTLDAAMSAAGIESVSLIKLDVDGYECDVIDGARETLACHRPVIVAELAPFVFEAAGRDISELVQRLSSHGYQLWNLRGDRKVAARDLGRLSRRNSSMNVLAKPVQ